MIKNLGREESLFKKLSNDIWKEKQHENQAENRKQFNIKENVEITHLDFLCENNKISSKQIIPVVNLMNTNNNEIEEHKYIQRK